MYVGHVGPVSESAAVGLLGQARVVLVVVDVGEVAPGLGGVDGHAGGVEALLALPVAVPQYSLSAARRQQQDEARAKQTR